MKTKKIDFKQRLVEFDYLYIKVVDQLYQLKKLGKAENDDSMISTKSLLEIINQQTFNFIEDQQKNNKQIPLAKWYELNLTYQLKFLEYRNDVRDFSNELKTLENEHPFLKKLNKEISTR